MILRVPENLWSRFREQMNQRSDVETAGVLLARPLYAATDEVFIVEKAIVAPDDAYAIRRHDQLQLDAVALNRLIRPARDAGMSVFTVHTHGPSIPRFSWADDQGDAQLMPALHNQISASAHGSIVIVPDGRLDARGFDAAMRIKSVSMRIVGKTIDMPDVDEVDRDECFDRQQLALGADGQRRLRHATVGVVGLGGTGSVTASQLLHLGVERLVLMDGDVVEDSNVSRIVGAQRGDSGRVGKTDVAARYAAASGLPTIVEVHRNMLRSETDLAPLLACDVVMSCVDRQLPRALLNRMAYDAAIPVIDMGCAFRVEDGKIAAGAGRVVVVGPRRRCLGCWGHIDPDELRIESLPEDEREQLESEGYIQGARVPEPSVMPFNVQVAGAAVTQLLGIVAGFASADAPDRLAFDFVAGTVRRNSLATADCTICSEALT